MSSTLIRKKTISAALKAVTPFAATKGVLPILEHVFIQKKEGDAAITLSCNDLQQFISLTIKAENETGYFDLCVKAKDFAGIISSLPDESICLSVDSSQKLIVSGETSKAKLKLMTLPSFDYPKATLGNKVSTFDISTTTLSDLFKRTANFASPDSSKSILTGINIASDNDTVKFQSTDGYTLSIQYFPSRTESPINMILPKFVSGSIIRALSSSDSNIAVAVYDNMVEFSQGQTTVICRLIDGKYPSTDKIIPKSFENIVSINKSVLKDALGVIEAANIGAAISNVSLDHQDAQTATLSTVHTQDTSANIPVDIKIIKGEIPGINLNVNYLNRSLAAITGDTVVLKMNSSVQPVIMTNDQNDDNLVMIMPVKP